MKKTIYFIRHGTALHNINYETMGESAFTTTRDTPLVEKGIGDAKLLNSTWKNKDKIELILVSPLTRTLETANIIFDNYPAPIKKIGIIAYQGDYGGDWAAGVRNAATRNGLEIAWEYIPPVTEFDVAQAAGLLITQPVDAYFPALSPSLMAQVIGGAAQAGVIPLAMLAAPSYNDAFVAEGFALKGVFESGAVYTLAFVDPFEADTAGHAAMRATLGNFTDSASTFLVAGWASQYHLKGVLEAAIKGGDITRAGIRRAAANVNVESDGMMPTRELGQNRADADSSIGQPDGSIPSGSRSLASRYVGETAAAYDWNAGPCS